MEPASPELEPTQKRRQPLLVSDIGSGNDHRQQQAHAVHQHVALAPFDPLTAVKASAPVGEVAQRHRLRIGDGHAGRLVALAAETHPLAQLAVNALPMRAILARSAVVTPASEVAIHSLPRRKLPRQHAPEPARRTYRMASTTPRRWILRGRPNWESAAKLAASVAQPRGIGWGGSFHGLSSLISSRTAYAMEAS